MSKQKDKIYALYDEEDIILGCFNREELKKILDTTPKSFNCIICRLKLGKTKAVKYKGKSYSVYIYDEVIEECMSG